MNITTLGESRFTYPQRRTTREPEETAGSERPRLARGAGRDRPDIRWIGL